MTGSQISARTALLNCMVDFLFGRGVKSHRLGLGRRDLLWLSVAECLRMVPAIGIELLVALLKPLPPTAAVSVIDALIEVKRVLRRAIRKG